MTPETNNDVDISIYYDFLEDQGIIVDRTPEEQDQWVYEYKLYGVVGDGIVSVGGGIVSVGGSIVVGGGGVSIVGCHVGGVYDQSERIGG